MSLSSNICSEQLKTLSIATGKQNHGHEINFGKNANILHEMGAQLILNE